MAHKVKITVVKKLSTTDVYGLKPDDEGFESPCSKFEVGQEIMVNEDGNIPEGFCAWAWHDLQREVWSLRNGGGFPWMKRDGLLYACCTDGLRPVFFKLERV